MSKSFDNNEAKVATIPALFETDPCILGLIQSSCGMDQDEDHGKAHVFGKQAFIIKVDLKFILVIINVYFYLFKKSNFHRSFYLDY